MNLTAVKVLGLVLACPLLGGCRTPAQEGGKPATASASEAPSALAPPAVSKVEPPDPWVPPSALPLSTKLPSKLVCGAEVDPSLYHLARGEFRDWLELFHDVNPSNVDEQPTSSDSAKKVLCDATNAATSPPKPGCTGPGPYLLSGLSRLAYLVGETKEGLIAIIVSASSTPYGIAEAEIHHRAGSQLVVSGGSETLTQYQLINWPPLTASMTVTLDRVKNDGLPPARQTAVEVDATGFIIKGPGCRKRMGWVGP